MKKFNNTENSKSGFTILELLTVVAIIGILSAVALPNLMGTREHARDSERITEIAEIALGLELYYSTCRQYPNPAGGLTTGDSNGCPTGVTFGSFLSSVPTDPQGGSYRYGTSGTFDDFVVGALLETNHKVLAEDSDNDIYSIPCSGPNDYCVRP